MMKHFSFCKQATAFLEFFLQQKQIYTTRNTENGPAGAGKFHHKSQLKVVLNGNKHFSIYCPSSTYQ